MVKRIALLGAGASVVDTSDKSKITTYELLEKNPRYEMNQLNQDIDSAEVGLGITNKASADADVLDSVSEVLKKEENLGAPALNALAMLSGHIAKRNGFKVQTKVVSTESLLGTIKDAVRKIIQAIKDAVKKVIDWFMSLFSKSKKIDESLEKRQEIIEDKVDQVEKADKEEFSSRIEYPTPKPLKIKINLFDANQPETKEETPNQTDGTDTVQPVTEKPISTPKPTPKPVPVEEPTPDVDIKCHINKAALLIKVGDKAEKIIRNGNYIPTDGDLYKEYNFRKGLVNRVNKIFDLTKPIDIKQEGLLEKLKECRQELADLADDYQEGHKSAMPLHDLLKNYLFTEYKVYSSTGSDVKDSVSVDKNFEIFIKNGTIKCLSLQECKELNKKLGAVVKEMSDSSENSEAFKKIYETASKVNSSAVENYLAKSEEHSSEVIAALKEYQHVLAAMFNWSRAFAQVDRIVQVLIDSHQSLVDESTTHLLAQKNKTQG